MERRMLVAALLSILVIVGWQMLFPPPQRVTPPVPEAGPGAPSSSSARIEAGSGQTGEHSPKEATVGEAIVPTSAPIGENEPRAFTLETSDVLVMFTNRGGRIQSWKLKDYKDDAGHNLELVPDSARAADRLPFSIALDETEVAKRMNSALFQMQKEEKGETSTAELVWADGAGNEVRKKVRIGPHHDAFVAIEVTVSGRRSPAHLEWGAGFGEPVASQGGRLQPGGYHFSGRAIAEEGPYPRRLDAASLAAPITLGLDRPRLWGGLEDTYFTAVFLPDPAGVFTVTPCEVAGKEPSGPPQKALTVSLAVQGNGEEVGLYVGPKDYKRLGSKGRNLQEVVHFQSGIWIIGPIVTLLTRVLFYSINLLHDWVHNWGVAIILLTVLVKLAFWPLTHKSMMAMKRMQEKTKKIQPRMAAIKERYRKLGKRDIESRQKMNQEIMALYQKEGVNPMGGLSGCMPILLQLPILYGFYNLLQVAIELRQAPFMLWIRDLSRMDPYYVLPIIMGGTMVIQQVLTGAAIPDPVQRRMMYMTPVMFTFLFLSLPSGLVLYWLVNNLLSILQQWMINKRWAAEAQRSGA